MLSRALRGTCAPRSVALCATRVAATVARRFAPSTSCRLRRHSAASGAWLSEKGLFEHQSTHRGLLRIVALMFGMALCALRESS